MPGHRRPRSAPSPGRHGKRYNWYTTGKPKPRPSQRDKWKFGGADPVRQRSRITRLVEEKEEERPAVDEKELQTKLHVCKVDLHIAENVVNHNTDDFECTEGGVKEDGTEAEAELVIRRGQEFKMTIHFDRPYSKEDNDLMFMFNLGDECEQQKELNAKFKVDEEGKDLTYKTGKKKKWGATVIGQEGNCLTVNIYVPPTVPVGEWEFGIRTIVDRKEGRDLFWQYNHTSDYIKILFNPWCPDDLVYMEDEKWRKEYVENDAGAIYTGSYRKIGARSWFFGQFDEGILDTALCLLRKGFNFKANKAMGSPAYVARVISTIVNSQDDNGVLVGNWSGDYCGGAKPTSWNGSVKILQNFMKSGKPTRYGQCWVFSAVTTTICRALGLPCRSVTNHSSAHNTDLQKLSIDVIKKKNAQGDVITIKKDSIWNFHVWNECWFRRPDLNDDTNNFDGWQVIDATPQERSDGVYCCGPAPVAAIKQGCLEKGHDTAFVYAEVNADRVDFRENEKTGRLVEIKRNKNIVGKCISTHKPTGKAYNSSTIGNFFSFFTGKDTMEREDLTNLYKYSEGSPEERNVNRLAEKKFKQMSGYDDDEESEHECDEEEPVVIEIEEDDEESYVGDDCGFTVKVMNKGSEDRTITKLTCRIIYKTYYDSCTDTEPAAIERFKDIKLRKGDSKKFKIKLSKEASTRRPEFGFNFEVQASAEFLENDHLVSEEIDFRLRRPDIKIKAPDTCSLDKPVEVKVSFTNPLDKPLTQCEVDLEGGFKCVSPTSDKFRIRKGIGPKATWTATLKLEPKKRPCHKKDRDLCIGLDSKELGDISGNCTLTLK